MDDGGEGRAASIPDSGDGHAEETDLIKLLARSYSVAANLYSVAEAVIERATDHPHAKRAHSYNSSACHPAPEARYRQATTARRRPLRLRS
jgi:hypothetical protein